MHASRIHIYISFSFCILLLSYVIPAIPIWMEMNFLNTTEVLRATLRAALKIFSQRFTSEILAERYFAKRCDFCERLFSTCTHKVFNHSRHSSSLHIPARVCRPRESVAHMYMYIYTEVPRPKQFTKSHPVYRIARACSVTDTRRQDARDLDITCTPVTSLHRTYVDRFAIEKPGRIASYTRARASRNLSRSSRKCRMCARGSIKMAH